ncbi:MAG: hypothetical protein WC479_07775 [Candidatus Izemoplasmatales bacterium]
MINPLRFLPKFLKGQTVSTEEGLEERKDSLSLDLEDKELITIIDTRLKEGLKYKQPIDAINEYNEKFYLGEQVDASKLFDHQSKCVMNKCYSSIETIVPILATKKREPIVMPAQQTDESRELAEYSQNFLSWKWGEQQMQLKLADLIRFFNINRLSVIKYRYVGDEYNDFVVEVKRPEAIVVDNKANPEDIGFIGEYLKDTVQGLIDKYATKDEKVDKKKKDSILGALGVNDKQLDSEVVYVEFWTPDFVVWKVKDTILDKKKNPNWLHDTKGTKSFNHFPKPKMPYILFSWLTLGKGIYGETTSLEQAIPVQKNINKRKRQISDNADQANGTWIFNENFIDRKEASKFTGAPGQHLIYKGEGRPEEAVGRLFPKDLGQQVYADFQDDKGEIDNIFGSHSTTRGERTGQKTATESVLLKESDFGRLDLMSQYIDIKVEELYNAFIQMSLVYYDSKNFKGLNILGPENSQKYIEFSRDNVEEGIEIVVRSEPLLAQAQMIEKYMSLYQAGAVDPLTMYERLNLPNPKELVRRIVMFQADPRMYLATFAVDENTEGMEDLPENTAKRDIAALERGEDVPPAPEITKEHIKEHEKELKSAKFKKLKKDIQVKMINHVRAEVEVLRQQLAQANGEMGMGAPQPPTTAPQPMPPGAPPNMPLQ